MFKQRERPLIRDPLPDHLRVFEAIAEKDPKKAQQAMSELIQLARMDTPISPRAKRSRTTRAKEAPQPTQSR